MFKIVAFDLDGTLADTIPMCITAFRNSISPYTDHELSTEEILHTFGLNEIGMVKAVVGQNWELAIEDFYFQYESLHNEVTSVFPGILNLLVFLKKKNIVIALITGKGEKSCSISLEKLGLSKLFDETLYGSEISPNKKKNMEYLLKKYSVSKEEFCYIGDTIQDIKDCQDIGVVCFSAAWQESYNSDILEKENPNRLEIRPHQRRVLKDGIDVSLTRLEYGALCYLAASPGQIFTKAQSFEAVWSMESESCQSSVANVIYNLRKKIAPDSRKPTYIKTVLGMGYKFASGE